MAVVESIFRIAADGLGTMAIQRRLYERGVSAPRGGDTWRRDTIKQLVMSDAYLPRSYDEVRELVSPVVAATLEPDKEYGIRWWNRYARRSRQVSEPARDGSRRYRRKVALSERDRAGSSRRRGPR